MDLNHEFTVHKPIEETWHILTDVERIAPCLPGAQLQEIEGETYRGVVKVKLGAINAQFKGEAHFVEKDDTNHRAVLKAAGRDTGGRGNAAATITAVLEPVSAEVTTCKVLTDLNITGKVANFGRGVLADVSDKLLAQFSDNLNALLEKGEQETAAPAAAPADEPAAAAATAAEPAESADTAAAVAAEEAAPATASSNGTSTTATAGETSDATTEAPRVRKIDGPAAEPIDLLEHARAPMLKLLLPALGGLVVIFLLWRRRRSR